MDIQRSQLPAPQHEALAVDRQRLAYNANGPAEDLTFSGFLDVLMRRWRYLFASIMICLLAAVSIIRVQHPVYSTSALIMVIPSSRASGPTDTFDEMAGLNDDRSIESQMVLLQMDSLKREAIQRLGLSEETFRHSEVDVKQRGTSNVLELTVEYSVPLVAQRIANAIVDIYLQRTKSNNQASASNAKAFLEKQLEEKSRQLAQKEDRLQQAKSRLGSPDIALQIQNQASALSQFETDLDNVKVQVRSKRAQLISLQKQLSNTDRTVIGTVTTAPNPTVTQLQSQLLGLEKDRTALLSEYQPDQQEVIEKDNQIRSVQTQLSGQIHQMVVSNEERKPNALYESLLNQTSEAKAEVMSLEARRDSLTGLVGQLHRAVSVLPEKERVLDSLSREVSWLTDSVKQLQQRYLDIRIDEEAKLSDGRLIEAATYPEIPVRPKKAGILAVGGVLGLILGLLGIMAAEGLDKTLRDPERVEENLGVRVLTGLPRLSAVKSASAPFAAEGRRRYKLLPFQEGVRKLYASIFYGEVDKLSVLMVTSPLPGEGKTTVAEHLGCAIARSGKRTVILDGDFVRSRLSERRKATKKPGLTDLVTGRSDLADVLTTTDTPNCFVVPVGTLSIDPAELFQSRRFYETIQSLKETMDVVIIDAPPLILSYGLFLARLADGTLLVAVPGQTPKLAIDRAIDELRNVQARIVGVCLNKVTRFSTEGSHYYPYNYHYDSGMRHFISLEEAMLGSNGNKAGASENQRQVTG
jgi:capsular exopolysaccharide synthesis family protein